MIKELIYFCTRFSAVIHVQLLGRKEEENEERRSRKHTYEVIRKPDRMDDILVDML
jgi:membrane-anchored glycerophosphoryl diester phosphodiesterase (GDPDase)